MSWSCGTLWVNLGLSLITCDRSWNVLPYWAVLIASFNGVVAPISTAGFCWISLKGDKQTIKKICIDISSFTMTLKNSRVKCSMKYTYTHNFYQSIHSSIFQGWSQQIKTWPHNAPNKIVCTYLLLSEELVLQPS